MDNKKTITIIILGLVAMAGILLFLFLPSKSHLANIDFYVYDTNDNFHYEVNERLELLVNDTAAIKGKRLIWEMGNGDTLMRNTDVSYTYRKAGKYYFTALPSSIPTLPCPDVPLPVAHTQQAVVVSNEDPKKLGRVQVKMNWQTGPMQTSWIRVLTPDAGTSDKVPTNRGFVFIPEKGDQVMVAFRYDDPNRPFVLGSLFHGKSGTGGGSSNKTKSLTTRSGCTITLDDEKGSVMMKDKEGNSYTADGEGNITISASKSITLCVGENKIMIDSEGNISSNAEKDITESAGANIAQSAENIDCTASSNYNISSTDFTASGSSSATVSGTTKATIDSSGTTAVAGTIVKLN